MYANNYLFLRKWGFFFIIANAKDHLARLIIQQQLLLIILRIADT